MYIHIYIYIYKYKQRHVYEYVHVYIYMSVCIYIYICIHISRNIQAHPVALFADQPREHLPLASTLRKSGRTGVRNLRPIQKPQIMSLLRVARGVAGTLSARECALMSFRKSTPLQNRHLNIFVSNSEQ